MGVPEATSDLYAADAQYHKDCYVDLMPTRNTSAQCKCNFKREQDHPEENTGAHHGYIIPLLILYAVVLPAS